MKTTIDINLGGHVSAVCQVTGRKPGYGKQVSHSHRRTSRRWEPNLQVKRYFVPSEGRWVRLRVSVKGMRTIDKRGIEAVVAELRAKGEKL
jgi:large subunit ribosomal protein L28